MARALTFVGVPFAYYAFLSAPHKRIYRLSDQVTAVPLPCAGELGPEVADLRQALAAGSRREVQRATRVLCRAVTDLLGVPPVVVEVLAVRPSGSTGELHGLYTWEEGKRGRLQVWMRTAARGQVVAFRTFLRTVLHELCHHLDLELLGLPETFHTRGFFQRESSLFHQLVPGESAAARGAAAARRHDVGRRAPPRERAGVAAVH